MKRLLTYGLVALVLTLVSCRESETVYIYPPAPMNDAEDFVNQFGPKKQYFSMSTSELPKTVTLLNGTQVVIPQNAIQKNGNYVSGDLRIEVLELLKRSDIMLSGLNTNYINGYPLHVNGILQIEAFSGGKYADETITNLMSIKIPSANDGHVKITYGDINTAGTGFTAWGPDMVDVFSDANEVSFSTLHMGWINSGVFFRDDLPAGDLVVELTNNPGELATSLGKQGNTFVYFCPENSNVAMQLYLPAVNGKIKSANDAIPVGIEGKLIAFSIKDRKFYYAESTISTSPYNLVILDMAEISVDVLLENIRSLDAY